MPGSRNDLYRARQRFDPAANARKPKVIAWIVVTTSRDPWTLVEHFDHDLAFVHRAANLLVGAGGVLGSIGQSLLDDPIGADLECLADLDPGQGAGNGHAVARQLLVTLHGKANRAAEIKANELWQAEPGRDIAQFRQRVLGDLHGIFDLVARRGRLCVPLLEGAQSRREPQR